jgi:hypothetical protein
MKHVLVLGAAALVVSCVLAQDAFAQRGRGDGRSGVRAATPGYVGRPVRVVVRPDWRYSDYLPYVPPGTPAFSLPGHAGKIDSCWGWDGYQWLNTCAGYYPGY